MLTAEWGVGYTGGMAGVIGLIYSCLLTRGVEQIAKDTDYPGCTLLGAHGYCTQELVNLLVVGRATSNVFDGDRHLGPRCGRLDPTQRHTPGYTGWLPRLIRGLW